MHVNVQCTCTCTIPSTCFYGLGAKPLSRFYNCFHHVGFMYCICIFICMSTLTFLLYTLYWRNNKLKGLNNHPPMHFLWKVNVAIMVNKMATCTWTNFELSNM